MEDLITQPTSTKPRVFKNKNFSLLFWGVMVSNIAHILFNFAISFYILEIANRAYGQEGAALIQGSFLFVSGIVLVLLIPFGGVMADRMNKVRIMYVTDYIRGATIIITGSLIAFGVEPIVQIVSLFIMTIILSANSSFFNPASGSLLRFIVSDEELQPAASYLQGSHALQSIIGLILGGIMYAALPIWWIFLINGIGYLISALTEMFIRYDASSHAKEISGVKEVFVDITDGIKYLFKQKGILAIMIMALTFNFFLSPTFSSAMPFFIKFGLSTEPSYLFDAFLTPELWYSLMSVAFSASAIIMSLVLSRQKTKPLYGKSLKKALIGFLVPIILIAIAMNLYYSQLSGVNLVLITSTLMMFALGIASISFNIPVSMIMQRQVDRNMLGKVSSVSNVLSQALIPFSAMLAAFIIAKTSVGVLYIYCSVGALIVAIWFVRNKSVNTI
jgi:MFS transporter, DHA3 family, macrolide efflux protein